MLIVMGNKSYFELIPVLVFVTYILKSVSSRKRYNLSIYLLIFRLQASIFVYMYGQMGWSHDHIGHMHWKYTVIGSGVFAPCAWCQLEQYSWNCRGASVRN